MSEADVRRSQLLARLPALVLVTDSSRLRGRDMVDVVVPAVEGGVNIVQVREKAMPPRMRAGLARRVRGAIGDVALLFLNGDPEVARESAAAGVHLPESDDVGAHVAAVRGLCGEAVLVSCAVHSVEAAQRAASAGADLLQFGTVFASGSKPGVAPAGIDGLVAVVESVHVPVIPIGGITAANAGDAIAAGAAGVAVIGAIFDAPDPRAAAHALRQAIAQGART